MGDVGTETRLFARPRANAKFVTKCQISPGVVTQLRAYCHTSRALMLFAHQVGAISALGNVRLMLNRNQVDDFSSNLNSSWNVTRMSRNSPSNHEKS
jgi:hypothetical protein